MLMISRGIPIVFAALASSKDKVLLPLAVGPTIANMFSKGCLENDIVV
jgi:hypothetical protein